MNCRELRTAACAAHSWLFSDNDISGGARQSGTALCWLRVEVRNAMFLGFAYLAGTELYQMQDALFDIVYSVRDPLRATVREEGPKWCAP